MSAPVAGELQRTHRLSAGQRERVLALLAAEMAHTDRRPLGEQLRAALLAGADEVEHFLWRDPDLVGYAGRVPGTPPTLELCARPDRPDAGPALLSALMAAVPEASLWTHGDRSCGRIAAAAAGLQPQRELLLMQRDLPAPAADTPAGVRLRPFDPATDPSAWLALNRAAFADLPDQAGWVRSDLDERIGAPWFDRDGLIVAESGGAMVGFHWTKIDPEATWRGGRSGEVYVIAVAEAWRGTGLAAALLAAGLAHLHDQGLHRVHLFVDRANAAAVRFYERWGFARIDSDRQFGWPDSARAESPGWAE